MGEIEDQAAQVVYGAALERMARDADHHPMPLTPGLRVTERDTGTMVLYEDVCRHQLTWDYLLEMDEAKLYWLAGHDERPVDLSDAEWTKLRQNAWRARAAAQRRADDRAATLAAQEHRDNRYVQVWIALVAAFAALLVGLVNLLGG